VAQRLTHPALAVAGLRGRDGGRRVADSAALANFRHQVQAFQRWRATASQLPEPYWGWLGWDQQYQRDPLTGQASGPYQAWQVIGCALTLSGLALGSGALRCPGLTVAVLPVAFTVAWSVPAANMDETGLWAVGAFLILAGTLMGSAVLALGGHAARRHLRS